MVERNRFAPIRPHNRIVFVSVDCIITMAANVGAAISMDSVVYINTGVDTYAHAGDGH